MRALACFTAVVVSVAFASPVGAGPVAYGQSLDELYRIDLTSRQATLLGRSGYYGAQQINRITGLGYGPDGALYGASDTLKSLVRVNTDTGSASVVGNFGLAGQGTGALDTLDLGMAFDCNGSLWLSSATTHKLWKVDPRSAATTLVGDMGVAITGLVARDGVLYGAAGRGDNTLYRINTATAKATAIGAFGPAVQWVTSVAMSFDEDGLLWAALNYVPPAHGSTAVADWSDLARIDPGTGKVSIVGPITGPASLRGIGLRGMVAGPTRCQVAGEQPVTAPVNSPWALGTLALLLGGAAFWRRRELLPARHRPRG